MKKSYSKKSRRYGAGTKSSNPGGIYATNPKTKMCDHEEPKKEKKKNLGFKFVDLDENTYRAIRADLINSSSTRHWRELNKKYGINGSFNFYHDLNTNSLEQYKKWFN
jgi:hypothetical protein